MLSLPVELEVAFSGSSEERELATKLLGLMRARGRFMSANAPIRLDVASVAEYFEGTGVSGAEERLRSVVAANHAVFAIDEIDGRPVFVTTRRGVRPVEADGHGQHDFARRLMTPQPKPERPATPVRERPRIDERWSTLQVTLDDLEEDVAEAALVAEAGASDGETIPVLTAESPV